MELVGELENNNCVLRLNWKRKMMKKKKWI